MALKRIYHPDAADPSIIADSWWEASADPMRQTPTPLEGAHMFDVAIIGGGFTGLNAALALATAGQHVTVLDAEQPGWGASGRNGGFCCLGGSKLPGSLIGRKYGAEQRANWHLAERAAERSSE